LRNCFVEPLAFFGGKLLQAVVIRRQPFEKFQRGNGVGSQFRQSPYYRVLPVLPRAAEHHHRGQQGIGDSVGQDRIGDSSLPYVDEGVDQTRRHAGDPSPAVQQPENHGGNNQRRPRKRRRRQLVKIFRHHLADQISTKRQVFRDGHRDDRRQR